MPPSGKCLRRIAPAAAMVNEFVEKTQNTNKTQLLASSYCQEGSQGTQKGILDFK
jgi:hypothetical protein